MKYTKPILIGTTAVLLAVGALIFLWLAPTYLGNYLMCIVGGIMCLLATLAEREPNQVGFDVQISPIPASFPLDILPICPAGKAFGLE